MRKKEIYICGYCDGSHEDTTEIHVCDVCGEDYCEECGTAFGFNFGICLSCGDILERMKRRIANAEKISDSEFIVRFQMVMRKMIK